MTSGDPFVGPRPFGSENTIFGRDLEIAELRYYLGAKRIVLLHSPSGAGKSSLLWARNGLLNKLRATGQFEVWGPARVNQSPGSLAAANRFAWSAINEFEKSRKEGARPAETFANTTLAQYVEERRPAKRVVLVFDQFEEILRVDSARRGPKSDFFGQLGETLTNPTVWALIAIREDYLVALSEYARMLPTHLQNQYRIDFLRREDQAVEAIRRPLDACGRQCEDGAVEKVLANLATVRVLEGDRYRSYPGDFVEPLQIQLVCADLWSRIRGRDPAIAIRAEDFGDLNKAISSYYDDRVRRTDATVERQIRQWFDTKLITADRMRSLLRREPKETAGLANAVIEELVSESYLVRQELRTGVTWFELAHDRLVDPVCESNRQWFGVKVAALQRAAGLWDAKGQPNSMLLSGKELRDAKAEVKAREIALSPLDEKFRTACEEAQDSLDSIAKLKEMTRSVYAVIVWVVSAVVFGFVWSALFTTSDGKGASSFSLWALLLWLVFYAVSVLLLVRYLYRRFRAWWAVGK